MSENMTESEFEFVSPREAQVIADIHAGKGFMANCDVDPGVEVEVMENGRIRIYPSPGFAATQETK